MVPVEASTGPDANLVCGVLYNNTVEEWHTHKDVNALYLAGYGEPLLMNSGYCGASTGCLGFNWNYIHDRAVSGNTALVDYAIGTETNPSTTNDHQAKIGSGITEGFTQNFLDYASGDSGNALPNSQHIRNLIFAHPQDNKNGYFVSFDEFSNIGPGIPVNLAFHPNSNTTSELTANTEYTAPVAPIIQSNNSAGLSLFFATQPSGVTINNGVFADWWQPFIGKYLFATYPSANSKKNIVSVLFPYDSSHSKPAYSRISGTDYTGATINHGTNITDVVLESDGTNTITYASHLFQGSGLLVRKNGSITQFYFSRQARLYEDGMSIKTGFSADAPVSIALRDTEGTIISPSTAVTFYHPGVIGLKIDNQTVSSSQTGSGWVRASIPAGTHTVSLLTSPSAPSPTPIPTPGDANNDNQVDGLDYVIWLNHYNTSTINGASDGDFSSDGNVDGLDYVVWLNNYGT